MSRVVNELKKSNGIGMIQKDDIIDHFLDNNVPVIQVNKPTKRPMWSKWQETTVEVSRSRIDPGIDSNYAVLCGPIDDQTTIIAIDFDAYSNENDRVDESIDTYRMEVNVLDYCGTFQSGTCGNAGLIVHSTNTEINELVRNHNKLVVEGEDGGQVEIMCAKSCMLIPPSETKCKRHDKICKKRTYKHTKLLRRITDDVHDEDNMDKVNRIFNIIDLALEQKESKKINQHLNTKHEFSGSTKMAHSLLNIIGPKYCGRRHTWMRVGMAVKAELGEQGYTAFDEWSQKTKQGNYDEDENRVQWDSWKKGTVSQGTLHYYAKDSSPKKYFELIEKDYQLDDFAFIETDDLHMPTVHPNQVKFFHTNQFQKSFEELSENGDYQFAELFLNLIPDRRKYVYYVNEKDQSFYIYNDKNILKRYKGIPVPLSGDITRTLVGHITDMYKYFLDMNLDSKLFDDVFKIFKRLRKKFSNSNFKKSMIEELKILINDDDIMDKIDTKQHILCFKDQCYDFKQKKYRPIEKDDYVLTHISYELPESDPEICQQLENIVKSFFNEDVLYTYLMDSLGYSCFTNKWETFNIWTGCGSNGKGVLMSLIEKAFGDYYYSADNKFLTGSVKTGQSDSTLYNCRGKKIVMVSEPQKAETNTVQYNIEKIKSLTGRDSQTCRTLYKENITFRPTFTLFCQCNQIPSLDKAEHAINRRFVCVPFNHKFVNNPDTSNPFEKKIDPNVKDKLNDPKYFQQFIRMLILHIEPKIDNEKLEIPKQITDRTSEYLDENNDVMDFLQEHYQLTDKNIKEDKNFISLKDLYNEYKHNGGTSSKSTFKYNMETNGFKYSVFQPRINGRQFKKRGFFGLQDVSAQDPLDADFILDY